MNIDCQNFCLMGVGHWPIQWSIHDSCFVESDRVIFSEIENLKRSAGHFSGIEPGRNGGRMRGLKRRVEVFRRDCSIPSRVDRCK